MTGLWAERETHIESKNSASVVWGRITFFEALGLVTQAGNLTRKNKESTDAGTRSTFFLFSYCDQNSSLRDKNYALIEWSGLHYLHMYFSTINMNWFVLVFYKIKQKISINPFIKTTIMILVKRSVLENDYIFSI